MVTKSKAIQDPAVFEKQLKPFILLILIYIGSIYEIILIANR